MIRYHNKNTGDVVEYEHADARLDMLPNWERLTSDEQPDPVHPDGILDRPQASPGVAATEASDEDLTAQEADKPPARSASKETWQEYATEHAVSDEEREEILSLTKDILVAKYGTK